MIKINLIQQRKARKSSEKGQQIVLIGIMGLVGVAALVWLFVHRPLQDNIEAQTATNTKIQKQNNQIKEKTKNFEQIEAAFKVAQEQKEAIDRLNSARAVPAWMLWELSNILTRDHQPSLTEAMKTRLDTDPNRQWQDGWDPKHVWITSFEEKKGKFKLFGGAQSDSDMTQLALRLQASMYFDDVLPEGGVVAKDSKSNVDYYTFTISGKVRY
jgi:Tfp pilus assembly protein PilN